MRNLLLTACLLTLTACQPANDKADTGEAIARDAGVGDGPTGRSGNPVARGAEKGPIPANIDEGVENVPAPAANDAAEAPADNAVSVDAAERALPIDPPR